MNIKNNNEFLTKTEYNFLRDNPNLGDNIILLGYGGSYAYGTNNKDSDVDVRGIATNTARNILTGQDFQQIIDNTTDTVIYSFEKMIKLLCASNPNTIEILGLKPEHYFIMTKAGQLLIENQHLFLSKRAIYAFGGYANDQLRRLENYCARLSNQSELEKHILKSIEFASADIKNRYFDAPDNAIKFYIDKSSREEYDTEIFCDINLDHYPLRDCKDMLQDFGAIVQQYKKVGKRNENAITHKKLSKHMMHLIRLYLMAFDILENGKIITYREKEHDFLMDIRNGKYLNDDNKPTKEFYDIVNELEAKLNNYKNTTNLPEQPDIDKVLDFVEIVNKEVLMKN